MQPVEVRRGTRDRALSAGALLGFLVIAACLVEPSPRRLLSDDWSSLTIYPWWALVLVVAGVGAALGGLTGEPGSRARAGAPGVTGVLGAALAGLGAVAVKHWEPAFGMGGGYAGKPDELRRLAVVIALAGAAVAVAALAQLRLRGALPAPTTRQGALPIVVGLALVVLLPVGVGAGASETLDGTSLGAFALTYSVPWGGSVVLSRWLADDVAVPVLGTCLGCALLALVGPQMTDLAFGPTWPAFTAAAVAVAAVLAWRLGQPARSVRSSRA